jgi:hypothetical protein
MANEEITKLKESDRERGKDEKHQCVAAEKNAKDKK